MTISVRSPMRAAVLLTTVALGVVLLLANAVAASNGASGDDPDGRVEHLVVTGDTLWDIAIVHTPTGGDVRRTVFDIRQANHLDNATIVPGQVLQIPVGA
ncbi:MAG: LysM peptidoglycan-binding domain-containing protein [Actinomycetota bacterium]